MTDALESARGVVLSMLPEGGLAGVDMESSAFEDLFEESKKAYKWSDEHADDVRSWIEFLFRSIGQNSGFSCLDDV